VESGRAVVDKGLYRLMVESVVGGRCLCATHGGVCIRAGASPVISAVVSAQAKKREWGMGLVNRE
jgi:hypothetical protein